MQKNYRIILYVACLTSFITITFAFGRYIFAVITPDIVKDLNFNYEFVGRINAFHQCSYLLFSLLGGVVSTIIGARLLISSSVILSAVSMISLYFVHNQWLLLAIVALQGIFAATSWVPMVEMVARSIKEEHRGKVLGIISSGTAYGLILNGALIPYILTHYNWQTVWLVFGMLSLIIGLFGIYVIYTTLDASLTQNNDSAKPKIRKESTGTFSRDSFLKNYSQYVPLIMLATLSGFYLIPFQTYIVPFMVEDLGLGHEIAGISWGLFGILGVISGLVIGFLADKFSAKKAMIITYGISAVAIFILILFHNTAFVLLSCGIFGLAFNGIFGLHATYVSRILPPEETARLFGFLNLAIGFGSMIGNYVGGYIKNVSGSFTNAYLFMAIMSMISLTLCFIINDDRRIIKNRDEKIIQQSESI